MITEEHLNHWITELKYQLTGILNEVAEAKVEKEKGFRLKSGAYVSFEYILEKATTMVGTIHCVEDDMKND